MLALTRTLVPHRAAVRGRADELQLEPMIGIAVVPVEKVVRLYSINTVGDGQIHESVIVVIAP